MTYAVVEQYSESEWRNHASQKTRHQYILAIKGGRAIGIIGGTQNAVHEFNLIAMWVNPMFRGRGIADLLISAIKGVAISQGYSRVVLSVSPDNLRAVNFYSRHNFVFIPEWEALPFVSGRRNQKMECVGLF